jgi:hypothetical protein
MRGDMSFQTAHLMRLKVSGLIPAATPGVSGSYTHTDTISIHHWDHASADRRYSAVDIRFYDL